MLEKLAKFHHTRRTFERAVLGEEVKSKLVARRGDGCCIIETYLRTVANGYDRHGTIAETNIRQADKDSGGYNNFECFLDADALVDNSFDENHMYAFRLGSNKSRVM